MIANETIGVLRKNTSLGSIDVIIVAVFWEGEEGERGRGEGGKRQLEELRRKKKNPACEKDGCIRSAEYRSVAHDIHPMLSKHGNTQYHGKSS